MYKSAKQTVPVGACAQAQALLVCATGCGRQVSSAALLGEGETLAIQHRGEFYILRQTRAGKLILTK